MNAFDDIVDTLSNIPPEQYIYVVSFMCHVEHYAGTMDIIDNYHSMQDMQILCANSNTAMSVIRAVVKNKNFHLRMNGFSSMKL